MSFYDIVMSAAEAQLNQYAGAWVIPPAFVTVTTNNLGLEGETGRVAAYSRKGIIGADFFMHVYTTGSRTRYGREYRFFSASLNEKVYNEQRSEECLRYDAIFTPDDLRAFLDDWEKDYKQQQQQKGQ